MHAPADSDPLAGDLEHILSHTRGLWEPLRGENLFITGGTGFIGRWLLESFAHANTTLKLNATLVVLSRDPEAFLRQAPHFRGHPAVRFVRGDVRQLTADDVCRQLGGASPERYGFVLHAATEASAKLNAEDPLRMVDTIVQGTRAALEFAVATGARRFLLTSSGAVYGRQPSKLTHLSEDYAGGPDCTVAGSAYGEGKRLAELLCACFQQQHGVQPLIARCFAFVGPFLPLDAHFAIGNFIRDALRGRPIQVGGDGTPFRSYLYAADLAIWLWTILLRGQPGRPYNVGSAQAFPIAEIATTVRGALDESLTVNIARQPEVGATAGRYVPDCDRAQSELALNQHISLMEAIQRTARHHRSTAVTLPPSAP